jgi:hypothetical protein
MILNFSSSQLNEIPAEFKQDQHRYPVHAGVIDYSEAGYVPIVNCFVLDRNLNCLVVSRADGMMKGLMHVPSATLRCLETTVGMAALEEMARLGIQQKDVEDMTLGPASVEWRNKKRYSIRNVLALLHTNRQVHHDQKYSRALWVPDDELISHGVPPRVLNYYRIWVDACK